ncbi:MAG TPA: copper resistance protein CopC, partial [Ktedonobacteraceae bacterium]|nr:copper resistance protein CopC [Ktedonobacteraceae bacterium]
MRQRRLASQGTRGGHPYLRFLLLALSVSILLFFNCINPVSRGPVALAHAFVIGSDPVDGSTISTVPRVVRIFFDAPISPASTAYVFTPDERMVDASHSTVSSKDSHELDTPLMTPDQLPEGSYTVRWTALSYSDGHTTHGVIGFNVGRSSSGLPG